MKDPAAVRERSRIAFKSLLEQSDATMGFLGFFPLQVLELHLDSMRVYKVFVKGCFIGLHTSIPPSGT